VQAQKTQQYQNTTADAHKHNILAEQRQASGSKLIFPDTKQAEPPSPTPTKGFHSVTPNCSQLS
jgi:hypothetical protein